MNALVAAWMQAGAARLDALASGSRHPPRDGQPHAGAWRRALEQAQWATVRPGAVAPGQTATPAGGLATAEGAGLAAARARAPMASPAGPDARPPPAATAATASGLVADSASTGPGARQRPGAVAPPLDAAGTWLTRAPGTVLPAGTFAAGAPPTAAADGLPRSAPAAPATPPAGVNDPAQASGAAARWAPWTAQAWLQGDQVSAAVRDPALDARQAALLGRALARTLAASGLQLAVLHVNGRPQG